MITSVPDAAPPRRAMVHHGGSPLSVPIPETSLDHGSINSIGYTLFSLSSRSEDQSHFAVAGLVMVALGAVMLLRPAWLV